MFAKYKSSIRLAIQYMLEIVKLLASTDDSEKKLLTNLDVWLPREVSSEFAWLDSNLGSLVSELTTLPTEPQPLHKVPILAAFSNRF